MKVTLPWPPPVLNPNARAHWTKKDAARKKYKADCYVLAKQVKANFPNEKISIIITFCPPDRRSRDMDNALSSIKAALDAVAEAWGVNDSRFRPTLDWGPVQKHGAVAVEVI